MPGTIFNHLAEATASAEASGDIMSSLGIDWQMLIFQIIGFSIVVFLLGKFVFPTFMRMIDEREQKIEEGLRAAQESEERAAGAEEKIEKQLAKARHEARDIVATAKDEAEAMMAKADAKAKQNAQYLLERAHDELDKEIIAAKKALHNETLELVAAAAGRVVGKTYDAAADKSVIFDALKEASE